jgi:OOP family OmpA-OmpF porin
MSMQTNAEGKPDAAEGAAAPAREEAAEAGCPSTPDSLAELRGLLLTPERDRLTRLQRRLDDPEIRAEELSELLPEAVHRSVARNEALSHAITPVVEGAIQASVERNPGTLVQAIFPVMGPAIRKAITSTLRGMIQSLNQVLEHSLSLRGLRWRLEALRTGKPFGEVVLLHTLLYQVEQVLLIHKETGLLLQHVVSSTASVRDAELVSGMLTAIQDFVNTSFNVPKEDVLDTMQLGELTVWIEPGPLAVVVGVVRGNASAELRSRFRDAVDGIHRGYARALERFQGNAAPFEACRPMLESCLEVQYAGPARRRISAPLAAAVGLIVLLAASWMFFSIRTSRRWDDYVQRLRAEPGIMLVAAEDRAGGYYVSGLRDPLAADPELLLREAKIDPERVTSRWETYHSADPRLVLVRARAILAPPATVQLTFTAGVLQATGVASRQWIVDSKKLAPAIVGVNRFQTDQLVDQKLREAESLAAQISQRAVYFGLGSSNLSASQLKTIASLAAETRQCMEAAQFAGAKVLVEITGRTDDTGPEQWNLRLGRQRAERVMTALAASGFKRRDFVIASAGPPQAPSRDEQSRARNRKVSFWVTVTPVPEGEGLRR